MLSTTACASVFVTSSLAVPSEACAQLAVIAATDIVIT
jgi:hypothetical protein